MSSNAMLSASTALTLTWCYTCMCFKQVKVHFKCQPNWLPPPPHYTTPPSLLSMTSHLLISTTAYELTCEKLPTTDCSFAIKGLHRSVHYLLPLVHTRKWAFIVWLLINQTPQRWDFRGVTRAVLLFFFNLHWLHWRDQCSICSFFLTSLQLQNHFALAYTGLHSPALVQVKKNVSTVCTVFAGITATEHF